jgi:hypothetical protein
MKEINVFKTVRPKSALYFPEGRHDYIKTSEGLPAMRYRIRGWFRTYKEYVLTFASDVEGIAAIDDKTFCGAARWSGSPTLKQYLHGPLGQGIRAAGDLIRGATMDLSGQRGLLFAVKSPNGAPTICLATAPISIVEEIIASVPLELLNMSTTPYPNA